VKPTNRRNLLLGLGASVLVAQCVGLPVTPPQPQRVYKVVFLFTQLTQPSVQNGLDITRKALTEVGFVEGHNIVYDYRDAAGDATRFPALASEVVGLNPDVIVCQNPQAANALLKATSTTPIVIIGTQTDLVDVGLVKDPSRPERNLTGLSGNGPGIGSKRLQLLKEIAPATTRVAFFQDQGEPSSELKEMQSAAPTLAVTVIPIFLRSTADIDRALAAAVAERADALVLATTAGFVTGTSNAPRIAAFAVERRWPTAGLAVDSGGLFNYNAALVDPWGRVGRHYVAQLLNGATPANLPIEGPTASNFRFNLCTASKIGLTLPPSIVPQVTEVLPCSRT
jgi:putative ABC transport system substrate-binding protein